MKTVGYDDLRRYGINPLTGEACPYGQRVLTDLNDRGKHIVCDLLGIPTLATFSDNWNSGSVASFMLPRSLFELLYVWCLISDGSDEIVVSDDGVWGREPSDDEAEWQDHLRHLASYKTLPAASLWPFISCVMCAKPFCSLCRWSERRFSRFGIRPDPPI
jgi:hypothetical protein